MKKSKKAHLVTIEDASHGFTEKDTLQQAMNETSDYFSEVFRNSSKATPVALKKATYQKLYEGQFLTDFSHGPITKGTINRNEVVKDIEFLNERMKELNIAIRFDAIKVENQLENGACSVIGLEFARQAIKNFEKDSFVKDMVDFVNQLVDH